MNAIELIERDDEPVPKSGAVVSTGTTPADLLRIAVQSGADLDRLERLMALQVHWEAREAEKAYNAAFSAFKAEAVTIIKNRLVDAGPLSGKRYAELFSVVNAVTPALSRHGLSTSWRLTKDEKDWLEVTCTLKHVRGHAETVSMGGPPDAGGAKNAIQARASTISYLERYTLKAICGVAEGGDDNDGNSGGYTETIDPLIEDGEAAATNGMAALTKWWGGLTAKQRGGLNQQFAKWRKAAAQFDQDGGARG